MIDVRRVDFVCVPTRDRARSVHFYGETLGLKTSEEYGLMTLHLAGDRGTLVYQKPDFTPATYTILNFPVDDIEAAVDELRAAGVEFEHYESGPIKTGRERHRYSWSQTGVVQGPGWQRYWQRYRVVIHDQKRTAAAAHDWARRTDSRCHLGLESVHDLLRRNPPRGRSE